jgi:hypothetical protein
MKSIGLLVVVCALVCGAASPRAQGRAGQLRPNAPGADAPGGTEASSVTPAEIQRMFEAVALVRAQDALKLSDDKYLPFLAKFKVLQEARRRAQQERGRLMRELNQLTKDDSGDEGQIKDRLKALQDLDVRTETEIHKAYEAVDSVLDPRQQARFRLFEQQMELQKLALVERAKQANRQQKRNPDHQPD